VAPRKEKKMSKFNDMQSAIETLNKLGFDVTLTPRAGSQPAAPAPQKERKAKTRKASAPAPVPAGNARVCEESEVIALSDGVLTDAAPYGSHNGQPLAPFGVKADGTPSKRRGRGEPDFMAALRGGEVPAPSAEVKATPAPAPQKVAPAPAPEASPGPVITLSLDDVLPTHDNATPEGADIEAELDGLLAGL